MQIRLLIISLIVGTGPIAQVKNLPPIVEKLASINKPVICFSLNNVHYLETPDLPESFKGSGQSFLKTKDQLFVQIDGTGRLYRLERKGDVLNWIRLDSTYFTGYNFGAVNFHLNNNFYSYGGNGFWIINGILRYFNPISKEWNIQPTSVPIQFSRKMMNGHDNFYYLDTLEKTLYLQGMNFSNERIINPPSYAPNKSTLFRLNILNGVYDTVGYLKDSAFHFFASTPWGVLVNDGKIIDVKNNHTYQLSQVKKDELLALKETSISRNNFSLAFFVDSMFYIGNYYDKIDSMKISKSDLIQEKQPFYTTIETASQEKSNNKQNIIIIALIGVIGFLLFLLFGKAKATSFITSMGYKMSNKEINTIEKVSENDKGSQITFRSSKIIELLEQRERDLLSFIYDQSSEERLTSIEEINKVIGAAQRSPEIQKRLRSDLIISINEKLSVVTKKKKPVIDKQRSEFDKRSFEYFILPEYMDLVKKIIE